MRSQVEPEVRSDVRRALAHVVLGATARYVRWNHGERGCVGTRRTGAAVAFAASLNANCAPQLRKRSEACLGSLGLAREVP